MAGFQDIMAPVNPMNTMEMPAGAPQQQQPQPQPPGQDKRSQWSVLLEDPNVKAALFRTGLQMMQGNRRGESTGAAVARSVAGGIDYYGARSELDRKRQLEERKLKNEERSTDAMIANREADTARTVQQTTESSKKLAEWDAQADNRKKTAELSIRNLEVQGRYEEARAVKTQAEADEVKAQSDFMAANPELATQMRKSTMQKPMADLSLVNARIGETNAGAQRTKNAMGIDNAKLGLEREELQAKKDGVIGGGKGKGEKAAKDVAEVAATYLEDYRALSPSWKARFPTVQSFILSKVTTPGETTNAIITEAKRLDSADQGAPKGTGTPSQSASGTVKRVLSEEDIAYTMKTKNVTREEVINAAKAKGYIIK